MSLQQVLSETLGVGVNTKRVRTAYMTLVEAFGSEMKVLMDVPTTELADALPSHGPRLADGIERVRSGEIHIEPGFDGQFGVVKVWPDTSQVRQAPATSANLSVRGRVFRLSMKQAKGHSW